MKKILLALTALIFTTAAAHAVEVKNWAYKGTMNWYDLNGAAVPISYAETSVDDDRLRVLYAPQFKRWYIEFLCIGQRQFVDRQPEFYVRTKKNQTQGRYNTDYLIKAPAVIRNGNPAYIIMELNREDLAALKTEMDMGTGYFTSNRVEAISGAAQDIGEYRTYGFPGSGAASAIATIEKEHGLSAVRAHSASEQKQRHAQMAQDEKNKQLLKWYEGEYAETNSLGVPLYRGCQALFNIDTERYPNMYRKNQYVGDFDGVMAITSQGGTKPDHIYISTGYQSMQDHPYGTMHPMAETAKIPLFVEDGKQYMRLRLGKLVPGIPYKRMIDFENDLLKFVAYDEGSSFAPPRYFKRCN